MAHPLGGPDLVQVPPAQEKYAGSRHLGVLPMGCIQCREGAKLVLFVTGLCDKECFYCPVSRDKMYRDVMFANERAIHPGTPGEPDEKRFHDLFDECDLIGAKGAGITGGDPMVVPDRVVDVVRALKRKYGPDFHIHLYTSCAFDTAWVARLKDAGLDEIRFHPDAREYANMAASWHAPAIKEALRVGLTTTIEVPCLPGKERDLVAMAEWLRDQGVHGLNMNELEFSDPNIANLKRFGYQPADDESQRVAGSRETAARVLELWRERNKGVPAAKSGFAVHFCSSPYKDAIQLMQRFRRRASRVARPFEEQTEEGTLVFGVLKPATAAARADLGGIAERLRNEFEVPMEWVAVVGDRIETAPWVAEELAEDGVPEELGCTAYLSEVHPTADRLEVERTLLPIRLDEHLGDQVDGQAHRSKE